MHSYTEQLNPNAWSIYRVMGLNVSLTDIGLCFLLILIVITISLGFSAGNCLSQQYYGEPVDEIISPVSVETLNTDLEFRIDYEDKKKDYKYTTAVDNSPKFKEKRKTYEQRFHLQTKGSVYHPNLLEFNLDGTIGLRQQSNEGGVTGDEDNTIHENNSSLHFFKEKKINFMFFSHIYETSINRDLYETIDINTNNYGARITYQHELFPMDLLVQKTKNDHDSVDYRKLRKENMLEYNVNNTWNDILDSEFRYTYKKIQDIYPIDQTLKRHDFNLLNILEHEQTHGVSNIFYFKRSGHNDSDQLQIHENFYTDHTETLRTFYNYNFNYFKNQGYKSKTNYGDIGLRHKLYESLETEPGIEVSYISDNDNFSELYYEPKLSVIYRKNVPGGKLTANCFVSYRKTDREDDSGLQKVFDERIVLSDERTTFLRNPNVITDTVTVRDLDGITLIRYVDYDLIINDDITEIRRRRIPNETPVNVDYKYESTGSLKYNSLRTSFNIRYSYRQLLTFYFMHSSVTHDEKNGVASGSSTSSPLQETKRSLYGTELTWRWFDIEAEYEDDSSDLIPFKAWRVRGNFVIHPTDTLTFHLNANHTKTKYRSFDRGTVTYNSVDTGINLRINNFLEANISGGYLNEDGNDIDTKIWSMRSDIRSKFRSLELRLETELLNKEEIRENRDEITVKFKLIRYFTII